jgi:site-specific DNA-methyltransferase (adenine-specific)
VADLELLTIKLQKMTIESTSDNTPTTPAITYSECYAQVFSRLFFGDCLIGSDKIESGSVDLILTDLPYGNMKNIRNPQRPKSWGDENYLKWDNTINPKDIFEISNRILRKNGKMVLFSQEPYTTQLINEAIPNVPFSYRAIWEKDNFANALLSNKAMVGYFEDILLFSKMHDHECSHPLRKYAVKIKEYTNYSRLKFTKALGHGGHQHFMEGNKESSQFGLCTEKTYNKLIEVFEIDKMIGFKPFAELQEIDRKYQSTFNLWEGNKYKSNILKYKKDYNGYHPTQKPILLLEDLIKTFSNEGNLVVDLTMGSGSTGVACKNTNRSFIGIEKDEAYFKIAEQRINARTLFS